MEEDLYASHHAALLRRNWALVGGMTVLGAVVGAALVVFWLPRQYRAAASVLFEAPSSASMALPSIPGIQQMASRFGLGSGDSGSGQTALAIATSHSVRMEIVGDLDLVTKLEAKGPLDAARRLESIGSIKLTEKGTMAVFATVPGTPRGVLPGADDDVEQRELARDIANAFIDVTHRKLGELVLTRSQRKANFLEGRLAEAHQELNQARSALAEAQGELEYLAPVPSAPPEIQTLETFQKELVLAQADERAASEELRELKEQLTDEELMVVSAAVEQRSGVADRLREQIAQAQGELAGYRDKGYSDATSEVRELLARIEALEATYTQELKEGLREQSKTMSTNPVREALRNRIATLEGARESASARLDTMQAKVGELLNRIEALPGTLETIAALQQEATVRATVYEVVASSYEMAKAEASEDAPQFTILDEAYTPPQKIAPSGSKTCAATAVIGFVLGALLAPSWERWRRRKSDEPDGSA